MTDLPFDFSDTLEAFECPETVQVYEKSGSYVNGYWTETKGTTRPLSCILLNVDEKTVDILAQGRNVDSAYCFMFPTGTNQMYINYQQGNTIQDKQSYVLIDGLEYVVVRNPETVKNAGFESFYAFRFKEAENPNVQ